MPRAPLRGSASTLPLPCRFIARYSQLCYLGRFTTLLQQTEQELLVLTLYLSKWTGIAVGQILLCRFSSRASLWCQPEISLQRRHTLRRCKFACVVSAFPLFPHPIWPWASGDWLITGWICLPPFHSPLLSFWPPLSPSSFFSSLYR